MIDVTQIEINNKKSIYRKDISSVVTNLSKTKKENLICAHPFYYFEINPGGNVTPCCVNYCKNYFFGNLLYNNLEEVWFGEKATNFRKKILNSDYTVCDKHLCGLYNTYKLDVIKKHYYKNDKLQLPQIIVISYDNICNLSCNICPPRRKKADASYLKSLQQIENSYFPYLTNCKEILLSGSGDPFGSIYSMGLIKRIVDKYTQVKFRFMTNGQLLSPNTFFNLGLQGRVESLSVSIHAASSETYKAVTGSDNFDRIYNHLKFYSYLKEKSEINKLTLNFVVCNENFRDIPAFAKLALELDAEASFTTYRNLSNASFAIDYSNHTPFNPEHQSYTEFVRIMESSILKSSHCKYDGHLQRILANVHK